MNRSWLIAASVMFCLIDCQKNVPLAGPTDMATAGDGGGGSGGSGGGGGSGGSGGSDQPCTTLCDGTVTGCPPGVACSNSCLTCPCDGTCQSAPDMAGARQCPCVNQSDCDADAGCYNGVCVPKTTPNCGGLGARCCGGFCGTCANGLFCVYSYCRPQV